MSKTIIPGAVGVIEGAMVIDMKNLPGTQIKSMVKDELQQFLEEQGFRRLKNKSLVDLRRIWLGFMYEDFFYLLIVKLNHCIVELNALDSGLGA